MLSAAQALRLAEEELRLYVGTILAVLVTSPTATSLPSYQLVLGDLHARLDVAHRLGQLARELDAAM